MRFKTCRRCGCPWNRAGNIVCSECGVMLAVARRPRPPRRVAAPVAVPVVPVGPATVRVPFGPRAGEPVSSTRLELAEGSGGPLSRAALLLVVAAAVLLVVLSAHGV